ncbi:hypothetical protein MBLNU230_g8224t1 [Neophaeotheca triangularis]
MEPASGLADDQHPATYFELEHHTTLIHAHATLMVIVWAIILPVATVFSLAHHRYTSLARIGFILLHSLGLLLGAMYNSRTPDLYPNNAHHKLGWAVTWIAVVQLIVGHLSSASGLLRRLIAFRLDSSDRQRLMPLLSETLEEHGSDNDHSPNEYRLSRDSGQGSEIYTPPLTKPPAGSLTSSGGDDREADVGFDDNPMTSARHVSRGADVGRPMNKLIHCARKTISVIGILTSRSLLILGYSALCTGIVAFGGFFEGNNMLNGVAHWIKGSAFIWLGFFTLARWAGAFADIGWAWNAHLATSVSGWTPSAGFVESALIFFYGATNIFLEHLSNPGGKWEARDLEHVAITVLFIGGGLCGMLVESSNIRALLVPTVTETGLSEQLDSNFQEEKGHVSGLPRQSSITPNPLPALVISLTGVMMSSHAQDSMISTMIHKQWGNLLTASSLARILTYVMMYIKPPCSTLPSHPPTEPLTSFGLMAGGMILMASSADTVNAMVRFDVDAMFFSTVTMGFAGLLMSWIIVLLALKGWALRNASERQTFT